MRDSVLMGTFVNSKTKPFIDVRNIMEMFETNKVFVFKIREEEGKFLLTFNIKIFEKDEKLEEYKSRYRNTLQLHRNKESNTLFTINSLNQIVFEQVGSKGSHHKVNWDNYKNSCVLLSEGNLKILQIKLYDIISIPKEKNLNEAKSRH